MAGLGAGHDYVLSIGMSTPLQPSWPSAVTRAGARPSESEKRIFSAGQDGEHGQHVFDVVRGRDGWPINLHGQGVYGVSGAGVGYGQREMVRALFVPKSK